MKTAHQELLEAIKQAYEAGQEDEALATLNEQIQDCQRTIISNRIWKLETTYWQDQLTNYRNLYKTLTKED